MIEPTEELLNISKGKEVYYTFFIDVGYLIAAEKYGELAKELGEVKSQIFKMHKDGHDVQLHIHPHWEKATWENGQWQMPMKNAYRLADFSTEERSLIIHKYKSYLDELIGKKCVAFRSGGWCIQPFTDVMDDFKSVGIKVDSSVIPGDLMITDHYFLDFRTAPKKPIYRFEDDVCVERENGSFIEFAIDSLRYSPLFFWQLYVLGKIDPSNHKMIGDGQFVHQGGRKKRVLTMYSNNHVSTDGYFAKKLSGALQKATNLGHSEMIVIGHPKGNTRYSIKKLTEFINSNYTNHCFTSFEREFENY